MEKKNLTKELIMIFWLFVIGSIIGYVVEMIVVLVQEGYFESRQGLIYGPFTPVYGIGAVIYYLVLNNIKTKDKVKIFLITMVLGGITEYLCSYVQEKAFGTISWDYSNIPLNINGRTSLLHCTYWGIFGVVYSIVVEPLLEKLKNNLNKISIRILTVIVFVFMIFNITTSCIAGNRQNKRKNNIPPKNKIDVFVDKYYPDEFMDKVYTNKKETKCFY